MPPDAPVIKAVCLVVFIIFSLYWLTGRIEFGKIRYKSIHSLFVAIIRASTHFVKRKYGRNTHSTPAAAIAQPAAHGLDFRHGRRSFCPGWLRVRHHQRHRRAGRDFDWLVVSLLSRQGSYFARSGYRYQERSPALYDQFLPPTWSICPCLLLDRLIDPFINLYLACPAYGHILLGADVSAEIAAAAAAVEQEGLGRITTVLQQVAPHLNEARARLVATVWQSGGQGADWAGHKLPRRRISAASDSEVKRMLLAYLEAVMRGQ